MVMKIHGTLLFILLATVFVCCEASLMQERNESKVFELNKKRLRELWQTASLRGLIKATARFSLTKVSRIEEIVYNQCEKDSKNTVSLAKCAVKVFDARDRAREAAKLRDAEKSRAREPANLRDAGRPPMFMVNMKKTPSYSTGQTIYRKQENVGKTSFYYSKRRGKVRNPIKSQILHKRKERIETRVKRDAITDAWEIYLEEERRKMKEKMKKREQIPRRPETVPEPEPVESQRRPETRKEVEGRDDQRSIRLRPKTNGTNFMGIPRIFRKIERNRRNVNEFQDNFGGTGKHIDYSTIAKQYFTRIIGKEKSSESLEKLDLIKNHFAKAEQVKAYYKMMNTENQKLFARLALPIDSRQPAFQHDPNDVMQNVMQTINEFVGSSSSNKLSIMSPRLFSIMPDKSTSTSRLLSPTLLSFHDDGIFSLPDIFEILTSDRQYQRVMLEMILELSGAGHAIDKVLVNLSDDMRQVEYVQHPLMLEMRKLEHKWNRARSSFSANQAHEFKKHGFTFLEKDQMELIYGNEFISSDGLNSSELTSLTREEKEKRVETDIRKLAALGRPKWPFWNNAGRFRREVHEEVHGAGDHDGEHGGEHGEGSHERINGVAYVTLHPVAFTNIVNHGIAMEAVTLSPHAFIGEIGMPEALSLHTLSPRAFIATILSPSALIARILSPTALRAEVLSPRALTAWVLSPEAMVAEVLSPRFLEPRVLSPEAMVIDILSPGILSPHVLSSESLGVIVLSPNILSPRISSEEKLLVEVLSPHILGGPHSHEEEEHEVLEIGPHSHSEGEGHTEHEHGHGAGGGHGHGHGSHGSAPRLAAQLGVPSFPIVAIRGPDMRTKQ